MCIETSIQSKWSFPSTKPHFRWNRAYFNVTSIALNDINVRGGNVIIPFALEIGSGQKFVCLILYVPSTIFQLNRDRSSWIEPVLS